MKDVAEAVVYGIVVSGLLAVLDAAFGASHMRLGWGPADWLGFGGFLAIAYRLGRRGLLT